MDEQKTLEETAEEIFEKTKQSFGATKFELNIRLVRARLKELKLTLKDVQRKTGVSYRTVHRWITGEDLPHPKNLVQLTHILDIELYQLVTDAFRFKPKSNTDQIFFVQRQIEKLIDAMLEDPKIPPEKKLDMLVKYHKVLTTK